LGRAARSFFPETVAAPTLMIVGTDTRHEEPLAEDIFRFPPTVMKPEDVRRTHKGNERPGAENSVQMIKFYARVIEEAGR